MSFFSDVADLVSGGMQIYRGIKGTDATAAEQQALGTSKAAERLAKAAVHPKSKKFRKKAKSSGISPLSSKRRTAATPSNKPTGL
jgi:hypothetical protein